jgi:predicted nucleic acid-binding protein
MLPTVTPFPPAATPLAAVLDTNVVLDWLVFRHPACSRFPTDLSRGRLRWLASTAMRDELAHVLGRGVGRACNPDTDLIWSTWERWATLVAPRPLTGAATRMRCTDPDDQKFIDLALGHGARWLISRDRAVLKIAKRSRPLGLEVLTPEAWLESLSGG